MTDHHDDRTPFDPGDQSERDLAAAIDRLPRAIEPGRDLWPGIAARLGRPAAEESAGGGEGPSPIVHPSRGWMLALAAALLLTLAGAGLGLWRLALSGIEPPRQAEAPETAEPAGAETTATAAPPAGEPVAVPAADAFGDRLLAALERKRYALGPDASAAVEADIVRLGLAVAELVAALADQPDEPALYHQLAARQRQEAELLMRLNRL